MPSSDRAQTPETTRHCTRRMAARDLWFMERSPGTYTIVIQNDAHEKIQVGQWGPLDLISGYYLYVGSALGPGGVAARVARHCRRSKPFRWHIDYITAVAAPIAAWYYHSSAKLEHRWAAKLQRSAQLSHIERFGSSDCRCATHLFYTHKKPGPTLFTDLNASYTRLTRQ